jgi:hypothetical protein
MMKRFDTGTEYECADEPNLRLSVMSVEDTGKYILIQDTNKPNNVMVFTLKKGNAGDVALDLVIQPFD